MNTELLLQRKYDMVGGKLMNRKKFTPFLSLTYGDIIFISRNQPNRKFRIVTMDIF